jgi:hypothetical protein
MTLKNLRNYGTGGADDTQESKKQWDRAAS